MFLLYVHYTHTYTCYQLLNALVFQPLFSKNVPEYDITTLFQECGIPARTLLVSPSCFTCPSDTYLCQVTSSSCVYLCLIVSLVPRVSEWKPPGGQPLCSATALAQDSHSYHQTIRWDFNSISVSRPKKFKKLEYSTWGVPLYFINIASLHGNINSCVTEPAVGQSEAEVWPEVGLQCTYTHNVGHALLIGLLGQNISCGTDSTSQVCRDYSDH